MNTITIEDLEREAEIAIQDCLGIHELRLGRIRPQSDLYDEYKSIHSYWLVLAPTIPNCDFLFFARVNYVYSKSSTIISGKVGSATRIDQQIKIKFDLDRTVMQPNFAFDEDYTPTTLGGNGVDFCRVIVRTWQSMARYDFLGCEFFKKSPLLQEIEEFKRQFEI